MMMKKLTLYCVSTAQKRCKRSSLLYHVITMKGNNNKKLSCFREAMQCFMSLNILLNHLRSFKVTPFSRHTHSY